MQIEKQKKVQPDPCHIPTIKKVINDAIHVFKIVLDLKNFIIGRYTQAVIAFVREICHLCQKLIKFVARYGALKLIGISKFNIRANPTAISL